MAVLVSNIADECRALLNDTGSALFTNTVLFPYIRKALDELQVRILLAGLKVVHEEVEKDVAAGITEYPTVDDLISPIKMQEKPDGASSDQYVAMTEQPWSSTETRTDSLRWWAWREQKIYFLGANTARDVKLFYLKELVRVTDSLSNVEVLSSRTFLGARGAALAARFCSENRSRADELDKEAEKWYNVLMGTHVKNQQGQPTRRRPFGYTRRMRRSY